MDYARLKGTEKFINLDILSSSFFVRPLSFFCSYYSCSAILSFHDPCHWLNFFLFGWNGMADGPAERNTFCLLFWVTPPPLPPFFALFLPASSLFFVPLDNHDWLCLGVEIIGCDVMRPMTCLTRFSLFARNGFLFYCLPSFLLS
uniref:Uncharacterized protein n=1 Tax=Caenorhabditis japonica TaxID=281687 RepID=A0A8R1IWM7_CAEJA